MDWLSAAGYRHYEISNFAKPGKESRHNSSYWKGEHYIGIGPSAHSFNGVSRQWNIANNQRYISSIQEGIVLFEIETLTPTQQLNEYIMTALRTDEGIELQRISQANLEGSEPTADLKEQLLQKATKFLNSGLIVLENQRVLLTRKGKLLADGIAADLFF